MGFLPHPQISYIISQICFCKQHMIISRCTNEKSKKWLSEQFGIVNIYSYYCCKHQKQKIKMHKWINSKNALNRACIRQKQMKIGLPIAIVVLGIVVGRWPVIPTAFTTLASTSSLATFAVALATFTLAFALTPRIRVPCTTMNEWMNELKDVYIAQIWTLTLDWKGHMFFPFAKIDGLKMCCSKTMRKQNAWWRKTMVTDHTKKDQMLRAQTIMSIQHTSFDEKCYMLRCTL